MKALIAILVVVSAMVIAALILGIPGLLEPNPVIAFRVAIGVAVGLVIVVYRAISSRS